MTMLYQFVYMSFNLNILFQSSLKISKCEWAIKIIAAVLPITNQC